MRNHIPNRVALEAAAIAAVPSLSLEEELIELGEQDAEQVEIAQDIAEADRVVEIADALEDLAVIADGIEEATPAEAALVEAAGTMAVAGTDVLPEEIVPAMEGFVGKKISTEGIVETAKTIWEKIRTFIEGIIKRVEAFIYRVVGTIPRLRKSIAALEDKVAELGGKSADGKIVISSGTALLSSDNSPIKGDADLKKGIADLEAAAKFVFVDLADNVAARGKIIETGIKNFDPAKAAESIAELRTALRGAKPAKAPGSSGDDKARFPGYNTSFGAGLLGNVSLAYKSFADTGDASDLGALDRYRNSGFDLVPTTEKPAEAKKIEIDPLSPAAMKDILKSLSSMLDVFEDYKRGPKAKALDSQGAAIKAASKEAEKKVAGVKSASPAEERTLAAYYRAALNMNLGYTKWVTNPAAPMMSHGMRVARSALVVVQKSISAYK